jgi:hypothetical protein
MKEKQKENPQNEEDEEKNPLLDKELDWTKKDLAKLRRGDKDDAKKEKP